MLDLISEACGGRVVEFNDEFFAEATNLIKVAAPVWKEDEYTDRGKWMDGWETRRRRDEGHDWCVIELGIPGAIRKVSVDTAFFTGNYPEAFSLDVSPDGDVWREVIPRTALEGNSVAEFEVDFQQRATHVRLNIYPDGGVARLRVEGDPIPGISVVCPEEGSTDLASAVLGGEWLAASDYHYSPPSNLLLPTPSAGMWDGWETRRRRGPGHDWATFRLGLPGQVESVVIDTSHFKGNSPGWISIDTSGDGEAWTPVLERVGVAPHSVARFDLAEAVHASHVKVSIHPDGGLARLRVLGRPDPDAAAEARIHFLNLLFPEAAMSFFTTACSSGTWAAAMAERRPFESVADVLAATEAEFDELAEDDWLQAFAGHPRIGEKGDATSQREQAGSAGYEEELARLNDEYESKFDFIYIVYASGKSGKEMIEIARSRLDNDRETELANAAGEQRKITATRLLRMLCQDTP